MNDLKKPVYTYQYTKKETGTTKYWVCVAQFLDYVEIIEDIKGWSTIKKVNSEVDLPQGDHVPIILFILQ